LKTIAPSPVRNGRARAILARDEGPSLN